MMNTQYWTDEYYNVKFALIHQAGTRTNPGGSFDAAWGISRTARQRIMLTDEQIRAEFAPMVRMAEMQAHRAIAKMMTSMGDHAPNPDECFVNVEIDFKIMGQPVRDLSFVYNMQVHRETGDMYVFVAVLAPGELDSYRAERSQTMLM